MSTDESAALQKKIIRQVEFYFGDRNLRRDEFLREQIKKGDGCIQLFIATPTPKQTGYSRYILLLINYLLPMANDLLRREQFVL